MRILVPLLLLKFIACSPLQVKSHLEVEKSRTLVFHDKTYAFLPFVGDAPKVVILEHADLIREKLSQKGYQEVESNKADLLISYDVLIVPRGSLISSKIALGAFGGWTSRRGMLYHSYGGVSGRVGTSPTFGGLGLFGGYSGIYRASGSTPYYENFYDVVFKIVIYDGRTYRGIPTSVLLKANVEGEGRSGPMFDVIPYLITGFFKSFPEFAGEKPETISEEEVWHR
ncbi:hypothetical protein EHQ53_08290 [Leptospira langatensis]|uniref:DUF4136 domain-containing protein n=1 Tax=Leptospira langatensis TaxID=2484983 RepID=A0A5F1ZUP1_9LEPT|nr:DUF4136 domain-containing protein [Leptospira langatensis]TGK01368.1 hypothetical protein EHO57_10580 [Leptospira langatensis]TGL42180.1 hypothetical protein EHQ53_08290 [Leptospira langatensis]